MADDPGDWITQAEAARVHGVTRQAIHNLVRSGRLKHTTIAGVVVVSRREVEAFRPEVAGRPPRGADRKLERILRILADCDDSTRLRVLQYLRDQIPPHPFEVKLGASAEVILDALDRSGDLTTRMFRGVIAEAAFEVYVVKALAGWTKLTLEGNPPYDFLLDDGRGPLRVQVKLQRSRAGVPLTANQASPTLDPAHFVAVTQRTRGGTSREGGSTRPYRFGEFDILAVSMQPSVGRWDSFRYSVARWLIPSRKDADHLATFQPVAPSPNDDWTDQFPTCAGWARDGRVRTIAGLARSVGPGEGPATRG